MLEQSSVGLQVTCCATQDAHLRAGGHLTSPLYAHSFGAQPSLWGWLEAPTVPVLYAAGELDVAYSSIARQLATASLPQSRLQVSLLPHAAHAVLVQARLCVCVRGKGVSAVY